MREVMNRKLNKKGFTLAELLVVVAIIAILVAVSIPIFTSNLENARESTDLANIRAAKAVAVNAYLTDEQSGTVIYNYDAENGTIYLNAAYSVGTNKTGVTVAAATTIKGYNQTTSNSTLGTGATKDKQIVQVTITGGSNITTSWTAGA